jgi:hypothetical protein
MFVEFEDLGHLLSYLENESDVYYKKPSEITPTLYTIEVCNYPYVKLEQRGESIEIDIRVRQKFFYLS